jgi:putative transposase
MKDLKLWRALLFEVKGGGLTIAPEIAAGDGALGFWRALERYRYGFRIWKPGGLTKE